MSRDKLAHLVTLQQSYPRQTVSLNTNNRTNNINHNVTLKNYDLVSYKLNTLISMGQLFEISIIKFVLQSIIEDVKKHRILVFKDQGIVSPERHLEIGRWFGQIESTFYDHPKSPLRDIFRVSNDEEEG